MVRLAAWVIGIAGVSYGVATGPPASLHNADSLIPIFVSLENWTLFYWGQDRCGMLVPLLALPIRDGFSNLVAQNAISIAIFLFGTAAAFRRTGMRSPRICALGLLVMILAWRTGDVRALLLTTNQSYAPALGLFGLAFALAPGGRWWPGAVAAGLMILGTWVNGGVTLLVLCVGAVAMATSPLRPFARPMVTGAVLSILAYTVLQAFAPEVLLDRTHVSLPSRHLVRVVSVFWTDLNGRTLGTLGFLLPAALIAAWLIGRRQAPELRAAIMVVPAGIGLYGAAMMLGFAGHGRHLTPAIAITLGLAITAFGHRWPALLGSRAVLVGVVACVIAQLGFTSPAEARRRLVETLGKGQAHELHAAGATVVTGDYWPVWPLTFALNLLHEEVDGRRPVLPVVLRAEGLYLSRLAQLVDGVIVVTVPADDRLYWTLHSGLGLPPLVPQSRTSTYSLFRIGSPR